RVRDPHGAVDIELALKNRETDRAARVLGVDLAPREVSVARVEEPALRGLHGDARVAARVAAERDEEDVGEPGERLDSFESEPTLAAFFRVELPGGIVGPVNLPVAQSIAEAKLPRDRRVLGLADV